MNTLKIRRRTVRLERQQGMAMALTLLVLLAFMSMVLLGLLAGNGKTAGNSSGSMTAEADASLRNAADVGRAITALNLADAGVQDTILWLSAQPAPPSNTAAFAPSDTSFALPLWDAATQAGSPPRAVVNYPDSDHTFSVTLYPNVGNAGNAQKAFLIESIGTSFGFKQILHVYLQQNSFGHYAFFEDGSSGGTFTSSAHVFDGPVHMNNEVGTVANALNWNDNTAPIFSYNGPDAFTTGFALSYYHNGIAVSGPPLASDTPGWAALSAGGPNSIKDGQNNIPLPTSAAQQSAQKIAALGLYPFAPLTLGPTVCPGGGIYIHGDVQQMTLSVDPANSANQIIELYQIDPWTFSKNYSKILLNTTTNQTTVQTGTYAANGAITLNPAAVWPAPATGLTNGVIYCDGNIGQPGTASAGGLKGVIADNAVDAGGSITHSNSLTIATDPTKNTNLDGNLVYSTQRQIQQDNSGNYTFIKSGGVVVTSPTTAAPAKSVPNYVPESADTGLFATRAGRLGVVSNNILEGQNTYDSTGTTSTGSFLGIELDAILFSYGTLSMQAYSANATLVMGGDIHKNPEKNRGGVNYYKVSIDGRLSDQPPPFFPTTSNRYTSISWQRVGSVIEGTP